MLKQATNEVKIEGILSEVNIHEDVSKKTNKAYIGGEVIVRVPLDDTTLEVPIRVYANQLTNAGQPNPAYDNIKKILDMKSIAACDGDVSQADLIQFTRATIRANDFYGRGGNFVSYPTVNGSFSRKVNPSDFHPCATFDNIIVVGNMKEEEDANGDLTGRLVITGILPQYGGKVDKIEYVVENPNAIKHISSHWQKGDTVRVCGNVNFTYTQVSEIVEMGFGEPEVKMHTKQVHDLVITKGSGNGFDADSAYDVDEIAQALQERQARLAEMKANADTPTQAEKTKKTDFGF